MTTKRYADVRVTRPRSVTPETLGAWVIKCNPRKTPVEVFQEAGEVRGAWCVADNYRSRLIRSGHRVLFWVAAHPQRGIWGAGRATRGVTSDGGRWHVEIHVPLFAEPLTAAELTGQPGLRSMEVFRSPQQANPSWVSTVELAELGPLLRTRARGR